GHIVVIFNSRIKEANSVSANFRGIARSMAGSDAPSPEEARKIRKKGKGDLRRARLVLIAENGECVSANSKSKEEDLSRAWNHFDRERLGDSSEDSTGKCPCGKPGGWCACARIVSNVDLFGEGVDIKSVDSVVIGSRSKSRDTKFTQAAGRAMRRWDSGGKEAGHIIIPEVEYTATDGQERNTPEMSMPLLMASSRMYRGTSDIPFQRAGSKPAKLDDPSMAFLGGDGRRSNVRNL